MTTIKVPDMMCEIWASPRRSRAERQRTPEKAPVSGFGYRYFFTRKSVTNCNFYGSRLEKSKK